MPGEPRPQVVERPERVVDIVGRVIGLIRERLPAGWSVAVANEAGTSGRGVAAVAELVDPNGVRASLVIAAKRAFDGRDLEPAIRQIRSSQAGGSAAVPLLAASFLSPSNRSWLERNRVSYGDAAGNLYVVVDRPALFLRDVGADRDPWRGPGRRQNALVGPPAARVARALVDFVPPVSVPELVHRSGASTGATYRVVDFLQREGLITRAASGPVTDVDWRRLLERWSQDYGFVRSNKVTAYLEPRGLPYLLARLASAATGRYALTGTFAAARLAPYAPARAAMIYADSGAELAEAVGLRIVDAGANVLIATGDYDVVFDRLVVADGVNLVAPSQAAIDLLTGPGRNPAEAEALLDWMETHESDWRC
jgi:hypothetical protein